MMKKMMIALLAMVMVVGTLAYAEEGEHKCACGEACDHKDCACKTCPKEVKEAAMKAMEGLTLGCVHVKKTDAGQVFSFAAKKGDKAYTVTVTVNADGKVTDSKVEEVKAEEKKD